ncbi:Gfo/Idh/MocA family oxidoreductase [Actinomyces faecalis]|uniref:Gfo/Idh/MocA family protein n=1 Tax=Actinomyces faecalis TaxID=2722820 RepID=UPI0031454525
MSGTEMMSSGLVDAVIIAVPDPFHAELVHACLDAGLPVLCEEPLTLTVEEAGEIIRKHDALERPLLTVGFMRRFDPSYRAMKARLASGSEGALLMTHSCHRNVEAYPGQDSSATITNSAVHEIDVLPWLAGSIEMPSVPSLAEADEYVVSTGVTRQAAYPADWRPRFPEHHDRR